MNANSNRLYKKKCDLIVKILIKSTGIETKSSAGIVFCRTKHILNFEIGLCEQRTSNFPNFRSSLRQNVFIILDFLQNRNK